MSPEIKRNLARMISARQRMIDVRTERIEQLMRVRGVLRALLADFLETLDPITNVRLAEVSAEGSKAHGNLAISLGFFEGTRLRLAVDTHARFSHTISIPSAFDSVARILEIRVTSDLARVEIAYEPIGAPGTRGILDLVEVVTQLLAHAVAAVEAEAPPPLSTAPVAAPVAAREMRMTVPIAKLAAVPGPVAAAPLAPPTGSMRATIAAVVPPPDVLTFSVG